MNGQFATTGRYTFEQLLVMMADIDTMSYHELYRILENYYHVILEHLEDSHSTKLIPLYGSPKFLFTLLQVLNNTERSSERCRLVNTFLRSTLFSENGPYIRDIAYLIAKFYNYDTVARLEALGTLDEELCIYLSIISKASIRDYVNINRINYTICSFTNRDLTPMEIIQIYNVLYPRNFTDVFINSMANDIVDTETTDPSILPRALLIEESLKQAVCMILETFDTGIISQILISYNEYCMFNGKKSPSILKYCSDKLGYPFVKVPIIVRELEKQDIFIG